MTLIFPQHETDITDEPGLHALVIGVGAYPHLEGGSGPRAAKTFDLGQLQSPVPSARRIAKWLLDEYRNQQTPLRSLEVLLSPPAVPPEVEIERASMANIEDAFIRWDQRCSRNPENIAFFYFCGHGLSTSTQFLLPDDFGDPLRRRWKNCIDFDDTVVQMRVCRARTQLYFLDACSNRPTAEREDPSGGRLKDGEGRLAPAVPAFGSYSAASEGRQAFAPNETPDGVTYFAQALLDCLRGAGVDPKGRKWFVTLNGLGSHLKKVMDRLGRLNGRTLTPVIVTSGDTDLHEVDRPFVMSLVDCRTKAARYGSEMSMSSGSDIRRSQRGDKRPWLEEVPPGQWRFEVTYAVQTDSWDWPLSPPCYDYEVDF